MCWKKKTSFFGEEGADQVLEREKELLYLC